MSNMTETVLNEWIQKVVKVVFILSTVVALLLAVFLLKSNGGILGVLLLCSIAYIFSFIFPLWFIVFFKLRHTKPKKLVKLKKGAFFSFFKSIRKIVAILFLSIFLVSLIANFINMPSDILGNSLSAIFNGIAFTFPFFGYKYIDRFPERVRLNTESNFEESDTFGINPATGLPLSGSGMFDISGQPFSNGNTTHEPMFDWNEIDRTNKMHDHWR